MPLCVCVGLREQIRAGPGLTLQLWTSCCCAAWFLLDEAACWAAAIVWVAAAAACLAAFCQRKNLKLQSTTHERCLVFLILYLEYKKLHPEYVPFYFTSRLLMSRFLIAFCAAALVAIRKPSAASRSFCCCSSLSGLAAAPCRNTTAAHSQLTDRLEHFYLVRDILK